MKRFVCMVFAWMLLCGMIIPANATSVEKGSIEIQVKYEQTGVTGGDLVAVRVGYIDFGRNVFRKFITDAEITNINETGTVTQLQNFYAAYQDVYEFDVYKAEIKEGVGKFSDLPLGLYLVYQETAAAGFHKLSPFLVTVPYNNQVDVSVASKSELKRDTSPEPEPTTPPSTGGNKLPQTGQFTWPIPWLAITGTALFALGWWLCFGRKEDPQ